MIYNDIQLYPHTNTHAYKVDIKQTTVIRRIYTCFKNGTKAQHANTNTDAGTHTHTHTPTQIRTPTQKTTHTQTIQARTPGPTLTHTRNQIHTSYT